MSDGTAAGVQAAIEGLLDVLEGVPDSGSEAPGTSPSHVRALLNEAAGRTDLPSDKILRWVGFARGVMAARGLTGFGDVSWGAPVGSGAAADPVIPATQSLMDGLFLKLVYERDVADAEGGLSSGHLADLLRECMTAEGWSVEELSQRLGFVQGAMAVWGMITVDGERDRTRPVFHAAYAARGHAIPPTVAVASLGNDR